MFKRVLICPLLGLLLFAGPVAAQQTWVGGTSLWNSATNWNPNGIPNSPTADLTFDLTASSFTVDLTGGPFDVRNLTFTAPAPNTSAGYTLGNQGTLRLN